VIMSLESDAGVTLVIRVIRSFPHRNIRNIVIKNISLSLSTEELLDLTISNVATNTSLPPPFRRFVYDSMKIEHQAHGSKTSDPVINTEEDLKLFLLPGSSLAEQGVKNETEISLFKRADYEEYKHGPQHGQTQW